MVDENGKCCCLVTMIIATVAFFAVVAVMSPAMTLQQLFSDSYPIEQRVVLGVSVIAGVAALVVKVLRESGFGRGFLSSFIMCEFTSVGVFAAVYVLGVSLVSGGGTSGDVARYLMDALFLGILTV